EVRVIRRRADGSVYRACPRCEAPLDIEAGEWVPAYPDRPIHGYRISQLFSARVDPAEILTDYETTRFPSRCFNLKIGIPWVDALTERHVARHLAARHPGKVWQNYISEHQKGQPAWDYQKWIVQENRTQALRLSREAIRLKGVVLPRAGALVEEFATHRANDAKRLVEDEETGEQAYRYIRTGPDHFSLAFTYDCIAAM